MTRAITLALLVAAAAPARADSTIRKPPPDIECLRHARSGSLQIVSTIDGYVAFDRATVLITWRDGKVTVADAVLPERTFAVAAAHAELWLVHVVAAMKTKYDPPRARCDDCGNRVTLTWRCGNATSSAILEDHDGDARSPRGRVDAVVDEILGILGEQGAWPRARPL